MEKEVWTPIEGYEGYEVSNLGRVRSTDRKIIYKDGRTRMQKGRMLRPEICKNGYLYVNLGRKGRAKTVHRLVAKAFLPNPDNLPCVNHKDENKANPRLENLEFCSYKHNNNWGTKNARRAKPIMQLDKNNQKIKIWESAAAVERELGINHGHIGSCCNGNRKTAGGYRWEYIDEKENK